MSHKPIIIPHPASRPRAPQQLRAAPGPGSPYSAVILLLFVELLVAFTVFVIPRETGLEMVRENGPVEMASVVFYIAAAVMALLAIRRGGGSVGALSAFMLGVFALRELDFHYRFTPLGIDRLDFYRGPSAPLAEKILVAAILVVVGAVLAALVVRGIGVLRHARRGAPFAISVLAGTLLLPVSVVLDQVHYHLVVNLERAGDSGVPFAVLVLEETVELLIPALFLVAAAQWIWRRDR